MNPGLEFGFWEEFDFFLWTSMTSISDSGFLNKIQAQVLELA